MGSPASSERRRTAALPLLLAGLLVLGGCGIDKLVSSPGVDDDGNGNGNGNGNGGAPTLQLVFTVQPTNTDAGERIQPDVQVTVRDQSGATVTAFTGPIRLEIAANPSNGRLRGDTEETPSNGVAAFDNLRIEEDGNGYTLRASASGVSSATSASFNISRQRPDDRVIAVVSGSGQQDTVAATLDEPYMVKVMNEDGAPAPGVEVTWAVASGGGVITPNVVATDGAGVARATHQLGTGAGTQSVTASAEALQSPVTFTAAALHGAAARITFVQQPTDAGTDAIIAPPVRAQVLDQFDNPATGYAVTVSISLVPLTGTPLAVLRGTLDQLPSGGMVAFPDLRVSHPGIGYRLRVQSGSLTADSSPFTVL
jgi:hypothetical protein